MTHAPPARAARPEPPYRDDAATIAADRTCPVCQDMFVPAGRQQFCSAACRKRAFRRRHAVHTTGPAPGARRRDHSVYECGQCGQRQVGVQRCPDCAVFGVTLGLGGHCQNCQEPVTLADLDLPEIPR